MLESTGCPRSGLRSAGTRRPPDPAARCGFAVGDSVSMKGDPTQEIVAVLLLGAAAQWFAWQAKLPSILMLLVAGFIAGPVTGWIRPDELFGDALLPLVSLSVAVILFEGGLSLRVDELRNVGRVVRNLLTIGVAVTWILASAAAHFLAGLDVSPAVILGALLTVTGPTVILPMLRHIRPRGRVASILRWEGIAVDPIGALLAVLVFEFVLVAEGNNAVAHLAVGLLKTVLVGTGMGVLAGWCLSVALRRYWIPDYLANPIALTTAIAVFLASEQIQAEAGLFAATIAGVLLAHWCPSEARRILEFKENIRTVLISVLFVVLSARFTPADFRALMDWRTLLFVAALILIVRPASVAVSTWRTGLPRSERFFLAWMAPRGIVAAAVSSVFALQLELAGHPQAKMLMLLTFGAIIATVSVYGLSASLVARRLGLAESDPQGVLIVGAQSWACRIAKALADLGFRVLLVDTNRANVAVARQLGLPAQLGSALAEHAADAFDLSGIGRLLALTPNDEVNALAAQEFSRIFGRANVYQLPPKSEQARRGIQERHLHGRWLFSQSATYTALNQLSERGNTIKTTKLSNEFDYNAFREQYGLEAVLLFAVNAQGRLNIVTAEGNSPPSPGHAVVALVNSNRGGRDGAGTDPRSPSK